MTRTFVALVLLLGSLLFLPAGQSGPPAKVPAAPRFRVPPGFVIEKVAGPPLVRYPLFAAFDDRGRLYWTEGRHGYKVKTREGELLEGLASRVWRCRTDGSEIERLCGGGFDNPVELAFTSQGDLFGTMDQGPGDALLHFVEGGVYPMEHPCLKEFPRTGPMLGAVRQYGAALPVALCGLCRYRSPQFGRDYQDRLFSAQFNVHRIEQHTLVRDGSTFRSVEKDFVTSDNYDVHFTDVLEDADGSLLLVDMGAWFNYGCPTSKIAKPEVLGAIYRIRKKDTPKVADP